MSVRVMARRVAPGQRNQEGRHPLIGAEVRRQQGGLSDVLAEQPEELLLEAGHASGQQRHFREGEPAQHRGVECHGVAGIAGCMDCVETDDFPGKVETKYLFTAGGIKYGRLHCAGADCGDGIEIVALPEDVVTGMERPDVLDEHVEIGEIGLGVALRQAGVGEGAGRAEPEFIAIVCSGRIDRRALAGTQAHAR